MSKKKNKIGDMPKGTANAGLRKKIIFQLLENNNKSICYRCDKKITSAIDLAIVHVDNSPELFWNLENLAFSHQQCFVGAAQHKEISMFIDTQLEDRHGNKLPTYSHNGKIYIAGKVNKEYNIRIKNKSYYKIETVVSVDGRDVITGEIGNASNHGYIINPFSEILIKGFRKSLENVAAFKFSVPSKSYSSKMGTEENVGIIGIAVYREKENFTWNWHFPFNLPSIFARPNLMPLTAPVITPYWPYGHVPNWINVPNTFDQITCDSVQLSSDTFYSTSSTKCSDIVENSIGTEYGATIENKMQETNFTRNNTLPDETWLAWYDTKEGLIALGVPIDPIRKEPKAFPDSERRFAQPPPK